MQQDNTHFLRKHLLIAVLLGLSLRLVSLYFVWGPQALDDYLDNIIPAWKSIQGMDPDLHNYRSPFYMWILADWLKLGLSFGIEHAVSQIRWIYLLQAVASLTGIYGVYRLTWKKANPLICILAMYLVAMHGLMPFASTRSFMESFIMGPAALAFSYLSDDSEDLWKALLGFALLGLCTLLRFQAGLFYMAWLGMFFFEKKWKYFWTGFLFGFVLLAAEAGLDIAFGRNAFQTLSDYIHFSSDQEKSGKMPWYNTWVTWLGFLYFPFSFLLGKSWWPAIKKNYRIFIPVLVYVIAHSLNPHKEERYLYPILPLSFVFLAEAWAESISGFWTRWVYNPIFGLINTAVLAVGCLVNTQVGLIGPFGDIEMQYSHVLYVDYDNVVMKNYMAPFFVRSPSLHVVLENEQPELQQVTDLFAQHPDLNTLVLMSISEEKEEAFHHTYVQLQEKYKCSVEMTATSLSDEVLVKLNPKLNQRRRPTSYFICQRSIN
jgi:hypothetical protein